MMNMVDPRPQPFNGQRRQQCPPEDASSSSGYPPLPTTTTAAAGNFLLPESQGAFTFSAEPTAIVYDGSMATLPSSGQESAFTPNAGSSFDDSSLHPDMINSSFPPPNAYMQMQNYSLSPASHSRNGQSISPSHSVDHLSPEAGYLSDPSYHDLSSYTTPVFNGRYLDESFSNLTFTDDVASNTYPYQGETDMSLLTSNSLNTYNAQPPTLPSNTHLLETRSQLLSPCPTNNSSPIVTEEQTTYPGMQYTANNPTSATPPNQATQTLHSTPIKQTQSPALTNSPGNMPVFNPQPRPHLASPIVRVENCSREESPSRSDHSRPMSKRSHGSRRSGNHLSPYPHGESSDEDEVQQDQMQIHPAFRTTERNEDGSWLTTGASGQAGLNPDDRQAIGDAWVPTIEEIVEHRKKEEKKLEVHEWLTKSEVGSEVGDGNASSGLLRPNFTGRRRAKSTNDANRQGYDNSFGLGLRTDFDRVDDSGIPGPGRYIDEHSEYDDYEDDDDDAEPESPPAAIDFQTNNADNTDVSYFPPVEQPGARGGLLGAVIRPWIDEPSRSSVVSSTRYQPPTSNAAMMRFRLRARDVESASLAATVGSRRSRRLSESDLGSVRGGPGVIKVIQPDPKRHKERQRRPSFLENILPKRTPSNLLKRKGSMPVQQPEGGAEKPKEPPIEKPKRIERIGSWGRPKSPRLDTNVAQALGPPSASNLSATGPWYQGAKNAIRRSRSRSDLGKSPGLKELMTQHGGPPMPMLASPLAETEATKYSPQPSPAGDDDDEDGQEPITMDLKVRSDPIIPTFEGFKTHARQLNPRLSDYMVERITQEQMRRYKRLLEFKVKHLNAVRNGNCASGNFCTALGGEPKQLPPRAGNKDSEAPFIGFQITAPGSSDDDGEPPAEGTVVSAQFPSGVPLPPVKRLPAEFECPLCFKVKKFYKPSDWTKHVHEDVQPFTCTFPNCGEPKSFKRKADWVRHENERHRQLENWTCQLGDCNHTCYRKDNFVQHLVREHKIAEPRARTGRAGNKDPSATSETEDIWSLVERCRRDTTKQPKDEPCRFCGNICNSWKKLTVHLAKHMEQISMPILPLVDQKQMNADTIISPVVEIGEGRKHLATPTRSPVDNPSRYNPKVNSTLAPGIDPYGQFPQDSSPGAASNVMHTYPPPQMVAYKSQPPPPPPKDNYANYQVENASSYTSQTYPGLQEPTKVRGAYVNAVQIPNQGYHNGDMQNGQNRFPMTPVSAVAQQQQQPPVFTTSPVDTTSYPAYFTQEPQNMTHDVSNMGFNVGDGMHFQQPTTYQDMSYMTTQNNYQYQGQ